MTFELFHEPNVGIANPWQTGPSYTTSRPALMLKSTLGVLDQTLLYQALKLDHEFLARMEPT